MGLSIILRTALASRLSQTAVQAACAPGADDAFRGQMQREDTAKFLEPRSKDAQASHSRMLRTQPRLSLCTWSDSLSISPRVAAEFHTLLSAGDVPPPSVRENSVSLAYPHFSEGRNRCEKDYLFFLFLWTTYFPPSCSGLSVTLS